MARKMVQADLKLTTGEGEGTQRVAVLEEPGTISLRRAEIPHTGEREIRVKITYVGICGSDLEAFRGHRKPEFMSFPARLGHEVAGVIDQVGAQVGGLKVGDKVACRYVWGAFAEYIVCEPFNVRVVPDDFSMKQVSLMEVLPGVLHAAHLSAIDERTSVLIMGQGVSGLMLTQVVALFNPKHLVVTDLKERNLRLASAYGATHTYRVPTRETATMEVLGDDFPDGFDVVIPALLDGDGMVDAIECAAFMGRIVMYGCIGICNRPVDFFKVHKKRLSILSTEPRRDIDMRDFFTESLELVRDGLVNTFEIVDRIVPLESVAEAFAIRNDELGEAIHVLIDCDGSGADA